MLSRQREFCSVAVNGEALASGLAVLVGKAGARSLASKTHRKSSRSTIPSRCQPVAFFAFFAIFEACR